MSDESGLTPIYDETGQQVGWWDEDEDGDQIAYDLDGETEAIFDGETGEELEYADDFEQRLEALEDYAARPPDPVQVVHGLEQADVERWAEDMDRQRQHLEQALGRPLLLDEARRLGQAMLDDMEAGDSRPDVYATAARLADAGQPLLDLDDENRGRAHEARTEFIAQRLADQERHTAAARGEDDLSNPVAPPRQDFYDMDDRSERLAYYADRLRGATDADSTYSSSDYSED